MIIGLLLKLMMVTKRQKVDATFALQCSEELPQLKSEKLIERNVPSAQ